MKTRPKAKPPVIEIEGRRGARWHRVTLDFGFLGT